MPLGAVVEVVNGWGTAPRAEAGEGGLPYPDRQQLADRLAVPDVSAWTDRALIRVADQLYPVFAVADRAQRARLVTGLLERTAVRPALRADGARLHDAWLVRDRRQAMLAAAAVALRAHLAEHRDTRLGVCSGRRCADVYVDTSPSGRRRFCSLTCQNRTRVAAFRSRRRATD